MNDNSSNSDHSRRYMPGETGACSNTPPTLEAPSSRLSAEDLDALRADVARKVAAIHDARERFQRAKVVTQEALAFEVSLSF